MSISFLSLHGYVVKFPYLTSYGETNNQNFFLSPPKIECVSQEFNSVKMPHNCKRSFFFFKKFLLIMAFLQKRPSLIMLKLPTVVCLVCADATREEAKGQKNDKEKKQETLEDRIS